MSKNSKNPPNRKITILIAIILGVIVIYGLTVAISSRDNTAAIGHGHSHD